LSANSSVLQQVSNIFAKEKEISLQNEDEVEEKLFKDELEKEIENEKGNQLMSKMYEYCKKLKNKIKCLEGENSELKLCVEDLASHASHHSMSHGSVDILNNQSQLTNSKLMNSGSFSNQNFSISRNCIQNRPKQFLASCKSIGALQRNKKPVASTDRLFDPIINSMVATGFNYPKSNIVSEISPSRQLFPSDSLGAMSTNNLDGLHFNYLNSTAFPLDASKIFAEANLQYHRTLYKSESVNEISNYSSILNQEATQHHLDNSSQRRDVKVFDRTRPVATRPQNALSEVKRQLFKNSSVDLLHKKPSHNQNHQTHLNPTHKYSSAQQYVQSMVNCQSANSHVSRNFGYASRNELSAEGQLCPSLKTELQERSYEGGRASDGLFMKRCYSSIGLLNRGRIVARADQNGLTNVVSKERLDGKVRAPCAEVSKRVSIREKIDQLKFQERQLSSATVNSVTTSERRFGSNIASVIKPLSRGVKYIIPRNEFKHDIIPQFNATPSSHLTPQFVDEVSNILSSPRENTHDIQLTPFQTENLFVEDASATQYMPKNPFAQPIHLKDNFMRRNRSDFPSSLPATHINIKSPNIGTLNINSYITPLPHPTSHKPQP